jgi:hypothetical protein
MRTKSWPKAEHGPNALFIKELRLCFALIFQGKNRALRVLTSLRDDLHDTTNPDRKGLLVWTQTVPLSTLKRPYLFVAFLLPFASYNKEVGNIDKMGNYVKKKKRKGSKKSFSKAKKLYKFNGFKCLPCKSFLPGLFERINFRVNDFLTVLVFYC